MVYKKVPQTFGGDPIEQFKRNVYVNPFHEDDIAGLIEIMGADHLLFGSDWPHPEGLAEPCTYVDHLPAGMAEEDVKAIMGGNLGADHARRPGGGGRRSDRRGAAGGHRPQGRPAPTRRLPGA